MFSLAPMTAPIPRQMATFSSQPTVTKRPLARPGGGAAWCAALWAWPALTPLPVGPVPVQKQEGLLSAQEDEETLPDIRCLVATAVITLFNVSDTIRDVTQTGGMCWLYQTGGRQPEVEARGGGGGREAHWLDGVCCPDEEVCEGWWRVLCAA